MNPYNYSRGAPPSGTQSGWPTNPNMYSMPVQYGVNPSQYVQAQPPVNTSGSGFYPQQAAGMVQGGSPILARNQYQQQQFQQQPLQQTNFRPIQQQPNYQGQPYQQQPYQQSYQQGYQQQPMQQYQQFHQSHMLPFQQQSSQPPGQPPAQPPAQPSAQPATQIDPTVARRQQEKMMRDAQRKKEFEEQKQKFRSMVIGAPVVNPVDALFGKPPSAVKKQPAVDELPKDEQEGKAKHVQSAASTLQQEKEKVEEPLFQQQLENVAESPSVDQLLSESLKTLDLKKEPSKVRKFQQSSFQKHKSQATSQQTTFVSSDKARNWSTADELSDIFSEADEFTQFEAAPIQQDNQVTHQMMPSQSQVYPQHQQHFMQSNQDDEFGTFQSIRAQPVASAIVTSNQQQTNTQAFAAFPQVATTVSSQMPSVIGQQMTGPAPSDDFGMFHSTITPSFLPASQQAPNTQQGGNRDSFGDFQSGTNNPTVTPMIATGQYTVHPSTIPVTSDFPYWQHSIDQLPKLYQDVFNTCIMADQFLDTQRLFPILSSSGLHRSLLRDMWSTVNQVQPGRLTKEEFCQILGLIALAQSGISNPSLLELSKQTHPLVPQLVLDVNSQHKQTTNAKEMEASPLNTVNKEGDVAAVVSSAIHTSLSTSALIQDSDHKYDVFKTIPEPSSSTLAFSEAIPSVTSLTTNVVTVPGTATVSSQDIYKTSTSNIASAPSNASLPNQTVDDSSNKYDIFKMTSNPPLVGFHTNNVPKITTTNQLLTSANQPLLTSASHLLISASQPPTSASRLLASASQPLTPTSQTLAPSQPLTSTNQPLTLASQPLTSMSQPFTSISQPLAPVSQPLTSTNQPLTLASQPLTSASQPLTSASQTLASATSTSQPVQDSSFEFGEFQGSSIEQQVDTSTSDNNWASFESAFNSNETGLAPFSTQPNSQNTTQEAFTPTTVSVSAYTSGPSQFAVFDEANFPPTNTSPPDTSVVPNHSEDKYSVFNAVRSEDPIASTTGTEDSEFGQFEMGQPPSTSQDAVRVEHYSTQMEILEKCLKACDNTLSTAADLLSQVKESKVLNELFNSTPGIEKAQGYFEIFKLAKRVASTALQLDGEGFTNIKKQWKKIVQAFPPGLLTKLSTSGNSPSVKPRSANQDQRCSICGFGSKVSIPGDALYQRDLFTQGETAYHVVCANMWSHLISKELPVCSQT